jgi:hypothetical protein
MYKPKISAGTDFIRNSVHDLCILLQLQKSAVYSIVGLKTKNLNTNA